MSDTNKAFKPVQSGPKAERKRQRKLDKSGAAPTGPQKGNFKAFGFKSAVRARMQRIYLSEKLQKKEHRVIMDRTGEEPPPIMVAVVGPKGVGKSTLIRSLIKNYTRTNINDVSGPITVVTGKNRRVTFFECPNDMGAMIDVAKTADLVLMLVDASFGFEMETFEFLNILKTHGFPRVMGVLTHLDQFKEGKLLKRMKRVMKHRFWSEICDGAKLFYLSGLIHGKYPKREIFNLGRFISVMKFRPLVWRNTHSYVVADRIEDMTPPAIVERNSVVDRTVALYGYVRGCNMKAGQNIHLIGVGDFQIDRLSLLKDPLPLPKQQLNEEGEKIRLTLKEKDRQIYAPMSDIGDIVYDNDAIYINIKDSRVKYTPAHLLVSDAEAGQKSLDAVDVARANALAEGASDAQFTHYDNLEDVDGEELVKNLQGVRDGINEKLDNEATISLFKGSKSITARQFDHMQATREGRLPDEVIEQRKEADSDDELDAFGKDNNADIYDRMQVHEVEGNDGHVRRKVVFADGDDNLDNDNDDDDDDDDDEVDVEGMGSFSKGYGDDDYYNDDIDASVKSKKRKLSNEELSDILGGGMMEDDMEEDMMDEDMMDEDMMDEDMMMMDEDMEDMMMMDEDMMDEDMMMMDGDDELEDEDEEDDTSIASKIRSVKKANAHALTRAKKHGKNVNFDKDEEETGDLAAEWKHKLIAQAKERFSKNSISLTDLVYGSSKTNDEEEKQDGSESEEEFFVPRGSVAKKNPVDINLDLPESLLRVRREDKMSTWEDRELSESIKNRFVTGSWEEENADIDAANKHSFGGDEDEEEAIWARPDKRKKAGVAVRPGQSDAYLDENESLGDGDDDFEMVDDNGVMISGLNDKLEGETGADAQRRQLEEKIKKKHAFLSSLEKEVEEDEAEELDGPKKKKGGKRDGKDRPDLDAKKDENFNFFSFQKAEQSKRLEKNREEFAALSSEERFQLQGATPGQYVRIELSSVPCEFIRNFDRAYPAVVGSLLQTEQNLGMVQVRLKKHRWHKKLLKSHEALVFSLGWRRFQSLPIYSLEDRNNKQRFLKYTPEHMHCIATFYGPLTATNTGIMCFRSIYPGTSQVSSSFRISGTGTVIDLNKTTEVVKKLKLVGSPFKIFKNTAYIQDMFNSPVEVAKFEGAKIRTVSGIRGQIKKAVLHEGKAGTYRATFEDKILPSDIVFCRTWTTVKPIEYYNPVSSMLLANKKAWRGMRTIRDIRFDLNVPILDKKDSAYKPIERQKRAFAPLRVPTKLLEQLPMRMRPTKRALPTETDVITQTIMEADKSTAKLRELVKFVNVVADSKKERRQATLDRKSTEKAKLKLQKAEIHKDKNDSIKKSRSIAKQKGVKVKFNKYDGMKTDARK